MGWNGCWIGVDGGPLVLLCPADLAPWLGLSAEGWSRSHYDRACALDAPLGLIDFGPGLGKRLVVGQMPRLCTWIAQGPGGILVEAHHGPFGEAEMAALRGLELPAGERTRVNLPDNSFLWETSRDGGDELAPRLWLGLAPGPYQVCSSEVSLGANTRVVSHWLTPA